MTFDEKSILKQYQVRKKTNEFKIVWSDRNETESENFNKAIRTFLQSATVNKNISLLREYSFEKYPFFVLKEEFERLLNLFPEVFHLRFSQCSISGDTFKILSKPEIFPRLNKITFIRCEILSFEFFDMFISKRTKVEKWSYYGNNFTATEFSSIFQTLSENNTMKLNYSVWERRKYRDYQEKKTIVGGVKHLLAGSPSLCYFNFDLFDIKDFETALIKLVEKYPSLLYLETRNKKIKNKKSIYNMFQSMLQERYDRKLALNELQLLFMGDGKTGKTSTIRSLCKKRFINNISSTLVLEDTNILKIKEDYFKPLTKYELSVQRVKNVLAVKCNSFHKGGNTSKYNLPFEKELLERTVQDDEFLDYFTQESYSYKTYNPFCRVSDFGGQEVFSSLHHLFMNPNAVYVLVFNLTKQNKEDINRLKFSLKSVVKNAPKAPIIFIVTYLKLFLRENKKEELEKTELKVFELVSETYTDFQVPKSEKISFFH
eukprot:snap_masked-scaffold_22-processed-gene-2.13-mRNA-1 protein AED:1.00 eAED:1.00 QI:0/0/0/0/1/1/8/0/486